MSAGVRRTGAVAAMWALGAGLALGQAASPTPAQTPSSPAAPPPAAERETPAAPLPETPAPAAATPQAEVTATPQAQVTAAPQGGTIHGTVVAGVPGKPGAVPLPGVAVTATNTLTGRKYTAATDIDGVYAMSIPKNGRYVVRAELTGFAVTTAEVVLSGDVGASFANNTDFGLQLASRAAAAEARAAATSSATGQAQGLQGLSLSGLDEGTTTDASAGAGNSGVAMPSLASMQDSITGDTASAGADSIAVSGQSAQMNGLANFSEDEIRQRVQDAVDRARANGQLQGGGDPTSAIVGMLGPMMGGGGPMVGHGGGRPGKGGPGGFGNFRNFNPAQPHGSLNYTGEFAALDSNSWSPTLVPTTKPSYLKNSFGGTLAGSPYIPGLTKPSTKQFVFLNFNGQRNTTPEVLTGTVPTAAQRGDITPANPQGNADLSGLVQTVNGKPVVTPIYDPTDPNHAPFANNIIPAARLSPQARYILRTYYPEPNVANSIQNYNYQTVTTAGQNSASAAMRYIRNFGANAGNPFAGRMQQRGNAKPTLRQNMNANFSYSHAASDIRNIFPILGGATQSNGYNFGVGYTIGYGRFNNNANVNWNRSHAQTRNYFTDTPDDPAQDANIYVPDQHAIGFRPNFYNGLPSLSFTNFTSLTNTNPSETIGQTISFSDSVSWRHAHHNYRWGLDLRRVHQDSLGGGNPLGTIVFTGLNTESPGDQAATTTVCVPSAGNPCNATAQAASGAGFADFLLGLPQQSKVQAGLNKIYLRDNVFDAYFNDDFRVANNVSLNYGVRYEYFAPYTEKNGRLANLTGVSTGTTSVGCVTPNGYTSATFTCAAGGSASLIQPDRAMWAPRFGVAYNPKKLKGTVLRAGYGINFNTSQFQTFAKLLAYQPPFATVQNNILATQANATGCIPTSGSALSNMRLDATHNDVFDCSGKTYQNSFAVDPNYRLGMVQIYNVDVQKTLPWGVLLNLGYNGSHGSNLDVTRAPNHTATTVTTPDAVAFTYEDSVAESTFNALTLNLRKRLQHGLAMGATYQYAHSIDDASSFGGGSSTSSIQNDADLHAERSNSSFDVRHKLTGNWLYELPVGPNRMFLNKGGVRAAILDGFSISGNFTITSGTYYTPSYQSTAAEIAAGGTYTLRPDRVFTQPIAGSGAARTRQNPTATFFNTDAFTFPSSVSGYGSASRYSIKGPGTLVVDAALSRTVPLGETRSFEARMSATNVFNTVQYSGINTVLDSATFGTVTGAAGMRKITFTGRFRF